VRRGWLPAFAYVAIVVAVFAVRPAPTPGPFLRDFEAYWSAGATWNAHQDPYGRAIWRWERSVAGVAAQRDEVLPFVNPPATLALWTLFARLPYQVAATVWLAILTATLLALVATASLAAQRTITPGAVATALALAIAFGPITSDVALGQLALPALLGAVLVAVIAERSLPTGVVCACIAFAQPSLALGLVSALGRKRVALALLLAVAVSYALGAFYCGLAWPAWYVRVLLAHGVAERFAAIQLTTTSIAHAFGSTARGALLVEAGLGAVVVAAALLLARVVGDQFARFAAFSALVPFVAGFFHEHDLVVAYPAALWCAVRTRGAVRSVALAGTLLVAVDWLGLAQRPTGIAQSALLACAATAAFAALAGEASLTATLPIVAGFAALFATASSLAAHHPLPIWPDALGAYHAPRGASIAAVWTAEQRASGLLAAQPLWAALRSLSLLGCALLAYAIYRHSSYCRTA
jgi:hypothetical protein